MGRRLTLRKSRSIAIPAISVVGCGFFVAAMFVLENTFFLVPFAGIAVCGILGWISITHESRAKEDVSRGRFLEIAGKPGIVVQECSPEGKARIGDVTWSAISSNGTALMVGEKITVQDMRDLKLIIKAKDSAMSVHH